MLRLRIDSPPRTLPIAVALLGLALAGAPGADAWLVPGHRRVAVEAADRLPTSVPAFFRDGAPIAGAAAVDPDVWRNAGTPALRDREAPEHFVDLELLGGQAIPERRSDYLRLLGRLRVEPGRVGAIPYAVVEGAERLALCFAEHRRWPDDVAIRSTCLLVAGWLAHFAADLTQPLHTTVHHDGRARADGSSPESGIHRRVDALLDLARDERAARTKAVGGSNGGGRAETGTAIAPIAADALWPAVRSELARSHALVDAVYALEPKLTAKPPASGTPRDAEVAAFALERERAAVDFVARIWLWSWERSAKLELPDWLER